MCCGQVRCLAQEAEAWFLDGTFAKYPNRFQGHKPNGEADVAAGSEALLDRCVFAALDATAQKAALCQHRGE